MEEIFVFRLIKLKLLLINIYDYFLIIINGFVIFVFINLEFLMKRWIYLICFVRFFFIVKFLLEGWLYNEFFFFEGWLYIVNFFFFL